MVDREQFLEEMRIALQDRRDAILLRNREKIAEMAADEAEIGGDSIDHTTSEQRRDAELRLHGRFKELLLEVEEAERRLAEGDYGECEECGEEIARARLRAKPEARYCVECQEALENEKKRRYKRPGLLDD